MLACFSRSPSAFSALLGLTAAFVACAGRAEAIAKIIDAAGIQGGLVVHLGCGDGTETAKLLVSDRYLVQGLDEDKAAVHQARRKIRDLGLYGKVSIRQFDGKHLPYAANLVNLIVSSGPTAVPQEEIMRVLAPLGVAMIDGQKTVKPWPDAIDDWTHFLHGPDNNAVVRDRVVAAPRGIQWVSKPLWGRSHEELASMSAAVSAKGRIFFVVDEAPLESIRFRGDWRLVGRDAFNGTLLWKREIPQWTDQLRHFRSGPVHLSRRLVSIGDEVYVTLGLAAPVTALDAATGETLRVYEGTENTEEILVDRDVLYLVVGSSEVHREGEGLFRRGEPQPTETRYVTAIGAQSGRSLWKKVFEQNEFLLPLTLAVSGENLLFQTTAGVTCLDAESGKLRWQTPRQTPQKRIGFSAPTLVVADDVVLCADRDVDKNTSPAAGSVRWGVSGWNAAGYARKGKTTLRAYSLANGEELWSAPCREGYNSPVDIFVVDGTVWVGADYQRYDLKTGAAKEAIAWKVGSVAMGHHRCYRNKASENFIFTGRAGIEVVSLETGWVGNNSWVRGTCQYGILPSNGLIYAPPDACGCVPKVKLPGIFAAAPLRDEGGIRFPGTPVLEKGPADGGLKPDLSSRNPADGWPMYRHDGARSGAVATNLPSNLKQQWSADLGGRLTQPVSVGDRVLVASVNTHTVFALDARDGRKIWSYTAGGRIDSSPTLHQGMVLFGSADGWVYALRSADGTLVWRFRAAPDERQVNVFGQLESIWPVHGSVLVQNDTLFVTAGRSTYLDGGIILYSLDPLTGKQLSRSVVSHIDPETDKQTGAEDKKLYGNDMEGSTSDILSGDGKSIFLKHLRFDESGRELEKTQPHLFSITGLLISDWFVRTYWVIGTDAQGGWGGWAKAAGTFPSGRLLTFDDNRIFGYGRQAVTAGRTGHRANNYHLFCQRKPPAAVGSKEPSKSTGKPKRRRTKAQPAVSAAVWSNDRAPIVRAMVLASDKLVVAGPPDLGRKADGPALSFINEADALAGLRGEKGASIQVFAAADGTQLSEHPLEAAPVFGDG